jgi:nucleoside-diphosphate-sugar epimerase
MKRYPLHRSAHDSLHGNVQYPGRRDGVHMGSNNTRIIVFGASGFLGQHLLRETDGGAITPVTRCLKTRIPADHADRNWVVADLLNPHSIGNILTPGSTVVNLAYSRSSPLSENIEMVEHLIRACLRARVSRLVHCSTAVVVGENPSAIVSEDTECLPVTPYEKTKYQIENLLLGAANDDCHISILRPTAVIGAGGSNLRKLLLEIETGNSAVNYVRSSLFGRRALNLVAAKDVVGALMHLCTLDACHSGVYICSADDDPDNRYHRVETIIRELAGKQTRMKPVPIPEHILMLVLRYSRSGAGRFANRTYSSARLVGTGFQRSESIAQAVRKYVLSELVTSKRSS